MAITLDRTQIEALIPHGPPFLFLDKAIITEGMATATYFITGEEYFLKGHFKTEPVFPASLMFEALGQLGVLFLLTTQHPGLELPVNPKRVMFASSDRTTCHTICRPGDTLDMSVKLTRLRPPLVKFDGTLHSAGKKVLSAEELTLAFEYQNSPCTA